VAIHTIYYLERYEQRRAARSEERDKCVVVTSAAALAEAASPAPPLYTDTAAAAAAVDHVQNLSVRSLRAFASRSSGRTFRGGEGSTGEGSTGVFVLLVSVSDSCAPGGVGSKCRK
jgi:hypothetical protein